MALEVLRKVEVISRSFERESIPPLGEAVFSRLGKRWIERGSPSDGLALIDSFHFAQQLLGGYQIFSRVGRADVQISNYAVPIDDHVGAFGQSFFRVVDTK